MLLFFSPPGSAPKVLPKLAGVYFQVCHTARALFNGESGGIMIYLCNGQSILLSM